ncbi:MAG: hypothetical protein NC833_03190 [Candidatus Omnitrophica bacterium]|nr:hypothetical protein [Candidatus Omnitrophota bacterium]
MENGIKFAKELEKEGANFYIELGMKADNLLTKKLFYTLAKQEIDHLIALESFILSNKYKINKERSVEEEIKNFFYELKEKSKIENQLQGYEISLNLEKKSYVQYEKLFSLAETNEEKKIYKFLMEQEKQHIEAVINVYSYLSETGDWFQKEESKVWNWMNL